MLNFSSKRLSCGSVHVTIHGSIVPFAIFLEVRYPSTAFSSLFFRLQFHIVFLVENCGTFHFNFNHTLVCIVSEEGQGGSPVPFSTGVQVDKGGGGRRTHSVSALRLVVNPSLGRIPRKWKALLAGSCRVVKSLAMAHVECSGLDHPSPTQMQSNRMRNCQGAFGV